MPVIVECHSCSRKLRIPEDLFGTEVQCPTCGAVFTAEDPDGPRPAPRTRAPARRDSRYRPAEPDEDEARPRRGRRAAEEDDDDWEPPRDRFKPGKVQAVAVMMLVGGILAILHGLGYLLYVGLVGIASLGFGFLCCLWPGPYYTLTLGVMATIKGSQLLGRDAHLQTPPQTVAVMQVVNIINLDLPNCVMGIISLIFLGDPEVQRYFRGGPPRRR